jgi:large subunit ribosomal protein L31
MQHLFNQTISINIKMSVVKSQKAPLEGVNPKQHAVNVTMTDGTKFKILTSWGKENANLNLDIDVKNHPAWQENKNQNFINANNERVNKFKNKFDFGSLDS